MCFLWFKHMKDNEECPANRKHDPTDGDEDHARDVGGVVDPDVLRHFIRRHPREKPENQSYYDAEDDHKWRHL